MTDNIESAAMLAPKIERFRGLSRAAGRAGTVVLNRKVGIDREKGRLEREWLPPILDIYREYLKLGVPFDDEFAEKLRSGRTIAIADLPPGQIIAGTPDECAEGLRLCIEATDPDYVVVDFGRGAHGAQYEHLRGQIELFGREVMPRFAET